VDLEEGVEEGPPLGVTQLQGQQTQEAEQEDKVLLDLI
tara:strand:+ start:5565 stop:5678 length:114 start_codon:yes stop_codon:yes gene_type:complete